MLNVYQSNRLEALVTVLAQQLTVKSGPVLIPETILVQSPGMAQWLKLEIAEKNGIAANISFPLPSSFIWRLYQQTMPDIPDQSPFNKDRMSWIIFERLPNFLEEAQFVELRKYLAGHLDTINNTSNQYYELRLFQLAEKIADVFDNYLMYRPNWLTHWQSGVNDLPDEELQGHQWQAILWREVVEYIESSFDDKDAMPALHRAAMQQTLLELLTHSSSETIRQFVGERICIFGISTLPEQQVAVFEALSRHIDVDIYWFNPCGLFWGDVVSPKSLAKLNATQMAVVKTNMELADQYYIVGNPLLASWGKVGKDYLDLLTHKNVDTLDIFIEPSEHDKLNALQSIQQDILQLEYRSSQSPLSPQQLHSTFGKKLWHLDDHSIQIHSCHSRLRELEVLKDNILNLLQNNPNLLPSDILVMMPDVNAYSPFIDGVFGGSQQGNHYIPYTVADKSAKELSPSLSAFVELLLLPDSRFTITDLLDLIEIPFISAKFDLDFDELDLIRSWVQDSQIKWAINGKHKANWQLPTRDLNTWSSGLKRMLLGISIDGTSIWNDVVPFSQIEGLQAKTLGKLLDFFNFSVALHQQLKTNRSVSEWQVFVRTLLDQCFDVEQLDEIEQHVYLVVREANDKLFDFAKSLRITSEVSYKIIHRHFNAQLMDDGVTQRFLAGKLNFCSLMPMRSVPFQVICVLGLNESEYPRIVEPTSFDLVTTFAPRKGDRSRKWDDRYLLLEALCSARSIFYLSYIGFSLKNNDALPPSVLVSELVDYLEDAYVSCSGSSRLSEQYLYQHKLQPFSPEYFDLESKVNLSMSFNSSWYQVALGSSNSPLDTKQIEIKSNTNFTDKSSFELWRDTLDLHSNDSEAELPPLEPSTIELHELTQFWQNPIRGFYKQRLDVSFETYTNEIEEIEHFSHNGLEQYKLKERFIAAEIDEVEIEEDILLNEGSFPTDQWGKVKFGQYKQKAKKYVSTLKLVLDIEAQAKITKESFAIDYVTELNSMPFRLQGNVALMEGKYVHLRSGRVRPVDIVSCWITHLLINANGRQCISMVFGLEDSPKWLSFQPIEPKFSRKLLIDWTTLFVNSVVNNEMLMWHTETAYEWLNAQFKGKSEQQLNQILTNALNEDSRTNFIHKDDYSCRHFSKLEDFEPRFQVITTQLLTPILEFGIQGSPRSIKKYLKDIQGPMLEDDNE